MIEVKKSESIANIATALHKFHSTFKVVKRNDSVSVQTRSGLTYNYNYSSLDNILEVIHPDLHACGLTLSQHPMGEKTLNSLLLHTSGEYFESSFDLRLEEPGIKSQGSAITYGRRYAACAILNISIEDDDDAGKASGDKHTRKKQADTSHNNAQPNPQSQQHEAKKLDWLDLWKDNKITERGQKAIDAVKSGKYTVERIKKDYRLNKKEEEYLLKIEAEVNKAKSTPGVQPASTAGKPKWSEVSGMKKSELISRAGYDYIQTAYELTEAEKLEVREACTNAKNLTA